MADRRTDAAHLVGRHARPDARAADQDAAVGLAALEGVPEGLREVGIVVAGVGAVAAEVDVLVAEAGVPSRWISASLSAAPAWSAAKATRMVEG